MGGGLSHFSDMTRQEDVDALVSAAQSAFVERLIFSMRGLSLENIGGDGC